MKRVLFAHPKDLIDLDDITACLVRATKTAMGAKAVEVVTAKDDWKRYSASKGGWAGWPASVAGVAMGQPRYDFVVVGDGHGSALIGKGTSAVVDACLSKGRDLVWWNGDATFIRGYTFRQVVGRRLLPGDNYKCWAELTLAPVRGEA